MSTFLRCSSSKIPIIINIELTVGFENNIAKNCKRKGIRNKDLCNSLKQRFGNVKYINLSMGAIGMVKKLISCCQHITCLV